MLRILSSRFLPAYRNLCTARPSESEAVSRTRTTITAQLWTMRSEQMKKLEVNRLDPPTAQPVSASRTKISLPMMSDRLFNSQYVRFDGGIRFGMLLEDMDAIAGNVAFFHTQGKTVNVTATVDNIGVRRRIPMDTDL